MASVFAQNVSLSSVKVQLDTMFSGLDKTKVPTGFLWDIAVNLSKADAKSLGISEELYDSVQECVKKRNKE